MSRDGRGERYKWTALINTTIGTPDGHAVLVVSFGRIGDMFGRVKMYNLR